MINRLILFFTFFALVDSAYAVGTIIATAIIGSGLLATATAFAINFALSYVISQILAPNFGNSQQPQDQGVRTQVPPDTTTNIPIVYGDAYLGGKFVDACLREDGLVMYYVMAISQVSPNGQFSFDTTKMYYGDRLITFDGTTQNKVVSLTDGAGNVDTKVGGGLGYLFISLYTSDAAGNITAINTGGLKPWEFMNSGDGVTSLLMGTGSGLAIDQQWTSTGRRMNGLAFAVVRLSYSREAETVQLQPITFACKQYLYGTGKANPGSVWYDYITNPIYGGAVDTDFVDADSANALYAYADQLITFDDYDGNPQTQPRYRINGVIDTSKPVLENIDQILVACDCWMQYNATLGKWALVINKAENASYAFNDSNIIGSITVGSVDITRMPNQIEGKFPDKTNRDQYNFVNIVLPNNLLYANEPVNKLNVNYDLVNDSVQALYLANRVLEQGREDLLVTIDTTYDGIQVEAGDVVSVTNTAYGWNAKLFRAMQVKEIALNNTLTAQIQLSEYNADVYDDKDITQYTPAGNSGLVSPAYFSALSAPTVTGALPNATIPNFSVNCVMPTTGRVTLVNLYYTTVVSPTPTDWILLGSQTSSNAIPYVNGSTVTFTSISLPAATYYFAFTVGNNVGQSTLSPASTAFVWNPDAVTKNAIAYLYQWNSVTPSNPNGTSTYTWATNSSSNYTGGNGWSTSVPANPGTPLIQLWSASKGITALSTAVTTTVDWTSGFSVQAIGANGADGVKASSVSVYQWSISIPAAPIGTSTYNWATQSFTPPSGWFLSASDAPSAGYTLWAATVQLQDSVSSTTTTINWTTSVITASGYVSTTNAVTRFCYSLATSALSSTPSTITTVGDNTFPPNNSWGSGTVWTDTVPTVSAGQTVYQSEGIYNPTTNNTVWNVPYISSVRFGSLSAISANLGQVTSGVVTGATIRTAATGARLLLTSGNLFQVYNSSNVLAAQIFGGTGNAGTIWAQSQSATGPAIVGQSSFNTRPGVYGYQDSGSGGYGVVGYSAYGDGVLGQSQQNGTGLYGLAYVSGGSSNHGMRGTNLSTSGGGVSTSGLVGVGNGYDFYAEGGGTNYGPFTGAHDVLIELNADIPEGYIVKDVACIAKKNISNTIFEVALTNQPNQVPIGVMAVNNGILASSQPSVFIKKIEVVYVNGIPKTQNIMTEQYEEIKNDYDYCAINAIGEGQVYVCGENGNIQSGDLISTSSVAGVGMKQTEQTVMNITVAKARESVTFDDTTTPKLIACIYLCG